MNRRKFLTVLVNAGGAAVAGIIGIPAVITAFSPVRKIDHGETWRPVGPLQEFPVNSVARAVVNVEKEDWTESLRKRGVFVWRSDEDQVVVFSRNCTDLSCPVEWDPGSRWFFCPCHGGIFNREGEPKAGPPDRPLYRYAHRVRDGILEIDVNSVPPMS